MSGSFLAVLLIILVVVAFWRFVLVLLIALALALLITGVGSLGGFLSTTAAEPRITITTVEPTPAPVPSQPAPR
jgi:hypothetical protein